MAAWGRPWHRPVPRGLRPLLCRDGCLPWWGQTAWVGGRPRRTASSVLHSSREREYNAECVHGACSRATASRGPAPRPEALTLCSGRGPGVVLFLVFEAP